MADHSNPGHERPGAPVRVAVRRHREEALKEKKLSNEEVLS
jgi:hypothetical protein